MKKSFLLLLLASAIASSTFNASAMEKEVYPIPEEHLAEVEIVRMRLLGRLVQITELISELLKRANGIALMESARDLLKSMQNAYIEYSTPIEFVEQLKKLSEIQDYIVKIVDTIKTEPELAKFYIIPRPKSAGPTNSATDFSDSFC